MDIEERKSDAEEIVTWTDQPVPPSPSVSFWEEYLIGKKIPARRFLANIEARGITVPDESAKRRFAESVVAKADRVARLSDLLQACAENGETVRRTVVDLAEVSIRHLGLILPSGPPDELSFREAVSSWLGNIKKRPVKPANLKFLHLLLQFGFHRKLINERVAMNLIASAIRSQPKSGGKKMRHTESETTPLTVLLASKPEIAVLSALLAYREASKDAIDQMTARIQSQIETIARFEAEQASLSDMNTSLNREIEQLRTQKAAVEDKALELEKQIVDMRDGYQHKLDDVRGHVRGTLQNQLTRWLETALDASRADEPWIQVIQERLEEAIKLIEKEIQWLRPSA
jgi:FtsZ-binding cell division protein ZapB